MDIEKLKNAVTSFETAIGLAKADGTLNTDANKYEYVANYEEITGFKTPAAQTVTIAANGSTVVRFNYDRIERTVTFNVNCCKKMLQQYNNVTDGKNNKYL